MDPEIVAGILGVGGSIVGAVIGGFIGRSDLPDKLKQGSEFWSLRGEWDSTWEDIENPGKVRHELLVVDRQKGARIYGHVTMDDEPDKRWDIEGIFSGRFLQLIYLPSKHATAQMFLDYGCYFFQLQGDGSFDGYSVGFAWKTNKIGATKHQLYRRKRSH